MGNKKYKLLADFLLVSHLVWIGVLLGGAVYIFYNAAYIKYHLIIISGTLFFNLFLGGCPLTRWEEKARKLWDSGAYYHHNSFVTTYLNKICGRSITSKQVDYILVGIKIFSYTASFFLLYYLQ